MTVVNASLPLPFLHQTQYPCCSLRLLSKCSSVSCVTWYLFLDLAETVLHGRNCAPNINAKSFSWGSLSLLINFQNLSHSAIYRCKCCTFLWKDVLMFFLFTEKLSTTTYTQQIILRKLVGHLQLDQTGLVQWFSIWRSWTTQWSWTIFGGVTSR